MKTAITLALVSAMAVLPLTGKAATIENLDQTEYQLRIVENGQERQVALQPGTEVAELCKSKCDLYLGTDPDPYDLMSADSLVIEGGTLYESVGSNSAPDSSAPSQ